MSSETKRINVTFPVSLLEELKERIPKRKRNQFIVETIERELRRIRLQRSLREAAGAWSDEDHPDLKTAEDIDRYVRNLRESAMPQSWDDIVAETQTND